MDEIKNKLLFPEEFVDEVARKVVVSVGNTPPVRKIRKSHLLTVLLGIVGFSIFTFGISKIFANTPGPTLAILGLTLMVVSGVSIHKLIR